MIKQIENKLKLFEPITLEEISKYRLLNRIDTKYICRVEDLNLILDKCQNHYKVQTLNNERIFAYESLYFDSPEKKTYFDHHQGKRIRYKIRFRKYLNTGDSFLEVKKKRNYSRTDKKRDQFQFSFNLEEDHIEFLNDHIQVPESGLEQSIWTIFNRITLCGKKHLERITIDVNLTFKNKDKEIIMPGLSIIEVKREKSKAISPFISILNDNKIRPYGVSKYILGNILLTPEIKHNRFRRKILTINNLCYGT